MSIIIDMSPQEISAIKQLTHLDDDAQAITQAAREFVRLRKLRELKAASGKVQFDPHGEELEDQELKEIFFPR